MKNDRGNAQNDFDHSTHKEFVEYYTEESLSASSINRMRGIFNCILRKLENRGINQKLNIADIGCGAGVMSMMWAQEGHNVYGLDVNEALLDIARKRAIETGLNIEFTLGSATNLPWNNESMDVCVAPELLEHVDEWGACLREFSRILKPNGVLYVSTANKLCPKQQEFDLPFYGWYPSFLKRYYENLARTTRPEIAGYAKYPAVNWFSFYQLRNEFAKMNMVAFDRFDIMDIERKSVYEKLIIKIIRRNAILRCLGHVLTPGLVILAVKIKNA